MAGENEPPPLNGRLRKTNLLNKTPLSVQNVSVPKQHQARFIGHSLQVKDLGSLCALRGKHQ